MSVLSRFGRVCGVAVLVLCSVTALNSCQLAKNTVTYDRTGNFDRQEFRDTLGPAPAPAGDAAPVPDFKPVLSTPQELRLPTPLVTVSVNQTVALRELLFELSEQADVDLELDPQIRGSIIFTAKERPFDEVVDRICMMSGLRYKFKHNVLRVELDRPFVKTYAVNYLNLTRSGKSDINTSVTVGGGESGGGGEEGGSVSSGSTSGGSSSEVKNEFDGDVWKELDEGLKHLLAATDTDIMLATLSDPVTTPVNPAPPPLPVSTDPNAAGQVQPPPLPGSPQVAAMPAAAAPTLNIAPASEPTMPNAPSTYTVSRQTGIISVFASERQQRQVEKFLNDMRARVSTQVLIEAKVFEVTLNDEFATGIDWRLFNSKASQGAIVSFDQPAFSTNTTNFFGFGLHANDYSAVLSALQRFGTVRALSSPRVTVLNNQPAVVNVAQSLVYFVIRPGTNTVAANAGASSTPPTAEPHSIPEGVLLNVIPSANPDTGEIFLNVRPTVTRRTGSARDPTPQLIDTDSTLDVEVPQMMTQEMESQLKLQSGQTVILGGLMQDKADTTEEGLPVASDIPLIGNLFKNHIDQHRKSELVIFLTAKIVTDGGSIDATDRKIYNTFSLDRHPAKL